MTEPIWIEEREVLLLHGRLLALHGGAEGLRDDNLLKSAISAGKADLCLCRCAGHHRYGVSLHGGYRSQPLNGYSFTASEEDAAQAVLKLPAGALDEAGYTDFLRANAQAA